MIKLIEERFENTMTKSIIVGLKDYLGDYADAKEKLIYLADAVWDSKEIHIPDNQTQKLVNYLESILDYFGDIDQFYDFIIQAVDDAYGEEE